MTSFHALCEVVTPCHLLLETLASTISRLNLLCHFFSERESDAPPTMISSRSPVRSTSS